MEEKGGDKVSAGEVLAEIETDKATMEWESPEDGILTEILRRGRRQGERRRQDRVHRREGRESRAERKQERNGKARAGRKRKSQKRRRRSRRPRQEAGTEGEEITPNPLREESEPARVKASPLARKIAAEKGIDLANLKGTGPGGRIVRKGSRRRRPAKIEPRRSRESCRA